MLALRYKAAIAPASRSIALVAPSFQIETRAEYGKGNFVAVSSLQAESLRVDLLNGVGVETAKPTGNITVAPNSVPAGSTNTYTVTYSPYASLSKTSGNGDAETTVRVMLPRGWTYPETNNLINKEKVHAKEAIIN